MKKFILLYRAPQPPKQEDMEATMPAWKAYVDSLKTEGKYDSGNPLIPMGKSVSKDGMNDVSWSAEMVSGYSIIMADDLDSAVEIAKKTPTVDMGATVEVREIMEVM